MLAKLLSQANIAATIFEAALCPNFRTQGGTLELSRRSGIAAIKAAGLYEEHLQFCRFDGSALGVCDKEVRVLLKVAASQNRVRRLIDQKFVFSTSFLPVRDCCRSRE